MGRQVTRFWRSLVDTLDKTSYTEGRDPLAAPLDVVPGAMHNAQRAPYKAQRESQQAVWDAIARDHPGKMRKAMRYLMWLDRMQEKYSTKV